MGTYGLGLHECDLRILGDIHTAPLSKKEVGLYVFPRFIIFENVCVVV